jgi:hypothetical protein
MSRLHTSSPWSLLHAPLLDNHIAVLHPLLPMLFQYTLTVLVVLDVLESVLHDIARDEHVLVDKVTAQKVLDAVLRAPEDVGKGVDALAEGEFECSERLFEQERIVAGYGRRAVRMKLLAPVLIPS